MTESKIFSHYTQCTKKLTFYFFITNLVFPSLYSLRWQKMEALEFPREGG